MPVGYIYNLYGVHSKDVKLVSLFLQQLVIRVSGKRQTVNVNAMQKKYLFLLLLFIGSLGAIPVSRNISMNSTREIEFNLRQTFHDLESSSYRYDPDTNDPFLFKAPLYPATLKKETSIGNGWNTILQDSTRMIRISSSDGIIHIQNPTFKPLHISIYSLTGRLVNDKILTHSSLYYFARKQYFLLKVDEDVYKIRT